MQTQRMQQSCREPMKKGAQANQEQEGNTARDGNGKWRRRRRQRTHHAGRQAVWRRLALLHRLLMRLACCHSHLLPWRLLGWGAGSEQRVPHSAMALWRGDLATMCLCPTLWPQAAGRGTARGSPACRGVALLLLGGLEACNPAVSAERCHRSAGLGTGRGIATVGQLCSVSN